MLRQIHCGLIMQACASRDVAGPAEVSQRVWQHAFRKAKSQVSHTATAACSEHIRQTRFGQPAADSLFLRSDVFCAASTLHCLLLSWPSATHHTVTTQLLCFTPPP
jgi:hypothetical protein